MKVILKEDISKLGGKGDLIEVAEGYGRNFLIPRGKAEEATREKLTEWKQQQESKKTRDRKAEARAVMDRDHLQDRRVALKVSAGEQGKLFGSVTSAQIADAIRDQLDTDVDKKDLKIDDPIRELGDFPVSVKLYPGIEARVTISVEAEDGS